MSEELNGNLVSGWYTVGQIRDWLNEIPLELTRAQGRVHLAWADGRIMVKVDLDSDDDVNRALRAGGDQQ